MSVWENRAALEKKIEKFRKEFENKLRQFDPKNADHYLAVIEENSDGEFYGELVACNGGINTAMILFQEHGHLEDCLDLRGTGGAEPASCFAKAAGG